MNESFITYIIAMIVFVWLGIYLMVNIESPVLFSCIILFFLTGFLFGYYAKNWTTKQLTKDFWGIK